MTEVIKGITEEASIAIDKLLLEGKKIPAIRLYRVIRECTLRVAKDKMDARQVYLSDIGLAVMVKNRRYCEATKKGKAWLAEHGEEPVKLNPTGLDVWKEADVLLKAGERLQAIQKFRIKNNLPLRIAKDAITDREKKLGIVHASDNIEEEFVTIEGYKIKVFSPFPPDANPFLHDVTRMGVAIGGNLMGMMMNHASSPCEALVLVDKPTGKRICIIPPSEDK